MLELMQRRLRYSAQSSFRLYHLCYYFSKSDKNDEDKKLIIDFKKGKEAAVRHFIVKALAFLEHHEMDEHLTILRPLHSHETYIRCEAPTPLDRLGWSLATVFDCLYTQDVLQKIRTTQPVKSLTIEQRVAELNGVYRIDTKNYDFNNQKLLIIDDVVTTGATVCSIISTILKAFPLAKINVLSLAWTPTAGQQAYIQNHYEDNSMMLKEPESLYGSTVDGDFLNGKTYVSLFV